MRGEPPTRGGSSALTACPQVNTYLPGVACTPFAFIPFPRNLGQHLVNYHLSLLGIIIIIILFRGKPPSLAPRPKHLASSLTQPCGILVPHHSFSVVGVHTSMFISLLMILHNYIYKTCSWPLTLRLSDPINT